MMEISSADILANTEAFIRDSFPAHARAIKEKFGIKDDSGATKRHNELIDLDDEDSSTDCIVGIKCGCGRCHP